MLVSTEVVIGWLQSAGDLSFATALAVATIFAISAFGFVPRTVLAVGVGAIYGLAAIPIILIGNTVGAVLAFLLARYVLAGRVRSRLREWPRLQAIANAVDGEGWHLVALLRFSAPIPNAALNYMFGVTGIGVWPYAAATLIFTLPQISLAVYIGRAGRAALLEPWSPLSVTLTGVGVFCLVIVGLLVGRKASLAIQAMTVQPKPGERPARDERQVPERTGVG